MFIVNRRALNGITIIYTLNKTSNRVNVHHNLSGAVLNVHDSLVIFHCCWTVEA